MPVYKVYYCRKYVFQKAAFIGYIIYCLLLTKHLSKTLESVTPLDILGPIIRSTITNDGDADLYEGCFSN